MATPEIQAYLEARAKYEAAVHAHKEAEQVMHEALAAADEAYVAAFPPRIREHVVSSDFKSQCVINAMADELIWFPLLVDEFGQDREAAEAAWALGQRPSAYTDGSA